MEILIMDMDRNVHMHRYGQLLPPLFTEKSNWKYLTQGYEENVQDVGLELGGRVKFQF